MSFVGIGGGHDLGGFLPSEKDDEGKTANAVTELILRDERALSYWEKSIHALLVVLSSRSPPLVTTDELRRCVEALEPEAYQRWGYYDKWSAAMATILLERGVISESELGEQLSGEESSATTAASDSSNSHTVNVNASSAFSFTVGDAVRVKSEDTRLRWRRPHLRVPGYIYGAVGRVTKIVGRFDDPFLAAFRGKGPKQALYTVSFRLGDIFTPAAPSSGVEIGSEIGVNDTINAEIYQDWLEIYKPPPVQSNTQLFHSGGVHEGDGDGGKLLSAAPLTHSHSHSLSHDNSDTTPHKHRHSNGHAHDHGDDNHVHEERGQVEMNAVEKEGEATPGQVVGRALLELLYAKRIIDRAEIRRTVEALEAAGTHMRGADLVVKAWIDPAFKALLLDDAGAAGRAMGIETSNQNAPTVLQVVENTPLIHNLLVCTLCSCYPVGLLGFSPSWYKSRSYRSRAVREPRRVLHEFGTLIPPEVQIKVRDSTADCRYLVLPMAPSDRATQQLIGDLQTVERKLARLVHHDQQQATTEATIIGGKRAAVQEAERESDSYNNNNNNNINNNNNNSNNSNNNNSKGFSNSDNVIMLREEKKKIWAKLHALVTRDSMIGVAVL